ncbi:MAG: hypothetical protein B7Y09_03235 [Polaromonas sp. 24-63-21]|nr:MAG: hypothetical protein B7Y09_03235 [Polaromonas sp. 24-63-21]
MSVGDEEEKALYASSRTTAAQAAHDPPLGRFILRMIARPEAEAVYKPVFATFMAKTASSPFRSAAGSYRFDSGPRRGIRR